MLVYDALYVLVPVAVFSGAFFTSMNEQFLLTVMVFVVLAQGINVIYGFTGYLPFGYVAFFGIGAYGMSTAVLKLGFSAPEAVGFGGLVSLGLAFVLAPMLRLRGAYFAIASFATALALEAIIGNPALQSLTNGENGVDISQVFNSTGSYILAVVLVGVSILAVVLIKRTRFGLDLRAIQADTVSASMAGVNVVVRRTQAWLICAVLGGLAGGIYAWAVSTFYPAAVLSFTISLFAIVFALFGGTGTILGPVIGAVVLYSLYNYIGISNPQYFQLIYGLLIAAIALFFPTGLAGLIGPFKRMAAGVVGLAASRSRRLGESEAAEIVVPRTGPPDEPPEQKTPGSKVSL
jgi:branched-chain amino acid transport system permease protein